MANVLGFAGLGVAVAAFIFSVLALGLPYWVMGEISGVDFWSGMWQTCFLNTANDVKSCNDPMDSITDDGERAALKATRAMTMLGTFSTFGAIVAVVLLLFVMKKQKVLGFIGGGLAIAGGVFDMIGFAVYVGELEPDDTDWYHAAFAFSILSWITAYIAGALILVAVMIKGDNEIKSTP